MKINKITKKLETIQLFGLVMSGFIVLHGIILISETIGISLLSIWIFCGFFTYFFTQGWIAVITLLMQIEFNARP